jgi:hypothetical protein
MVSLGGCIGIAVHSAFSYLGEIWRIREATQGHAAALDSYAASRRLFMSVARPALAVCAIGSLCFSVAILIGGTRYPTWVALFPPFLWIVVVRERLGKLPWPVVHWLRPARVHIVTLPLLVATTCLFL